MNKAMIFKAAHKLAKTFEGNYSACFSLALKEFYYDIQSSEFVCNTKRSRLDLVSTSIMNYFTAKFAA